MKTTPKLKAFTLIEVVLALAVVVFAGFSLIGLLSVGLESSRESRERTQAATIAEEICTVRRASPTNDFTGSTSTQPNFPLPVLETAANNLNSGTPAPLYLTRDGETTLTQQGSSFGFLYNIIPSGTTPGVSTVYMCMYWPPQASPTLPSTSHFELTTTFATP